VVIYYYYKIQEKIIEEKVKNILVRVANSVITYVNEKDEVGYCIYCETHVVMEILRMKNYESY
jgi:hypothetical protein